MTDLVAIQKVEINWNEGYANSPDVNVWLEEEDFRIPEGQEYTLVNFGSDGNSEPSFALFTNYRGIADYGIYKASLAPSGPNAMSVCSRRFAVRSGDKIGYVSPRTYSSSRATIMNLINGSDYFYDVRLCSHRNYGSAITEKLAEKVANKLSEDGIYLLAVNRKEPGRCSVPGEDRVHVLMPSLSKTEIVFPNSVKAKGESTNEKYQICYVFGN